MEEKRNSEKMIERIDYKKFLVIVISGYAVSVLCICISEFLYWLACLIMAAIGIYFLKNASRAVNVLNTVCDGQGKKSWKAVIVMIISYITFNIYGIYWIYKQSKRMGDKAKECNVFISDRTALQWAVVGGIYQFILGILISKWETEYGYQFWISKKYLCLAWGLSFGGLLIEAVCIYFFLKDLDSLVGNHNKHINVELPVTPPVVVEEPSTIRDYSIFRHYLKFLSGMYEGICFPLEDNEYLVLGRESQKSNIVFEDSTVSRQHCQIRYNAVKRKFEIIDRSSVGTYADGVRIEHEIASFFQAGTQIQLGTSDNIFILQEEKEIL